MRRTIPRSRVAASAIGAVILGVAGLALAAATVQDDPKAAIDAMIRRPTAEHALLKKDVGTWDASLKLWMAPDAPPTESKGVETNTLLGDGLWLIGEFKGEFAGQPFVGRSQFGYDAKKGKYVATWIDSMTDHVGILEGSYDEPSKSLTMTMDTTDHATGKPVKETHLVKYLDDKTRVFTLSQPGPDGKAVTIMEITYKRRTP